MRAKLVLRAESRANIWLSPPPPPPTSTVTSVAVRSKALVLLLMIHFFIVAPIVLYGGVFGPHFVVS